MKNCIILLVILLQIVAKAQKSAEYLPDKPGKVILNQYSMNVADELHRNVKQVAEWFIQKAPVLTNPKGFDLWVYFTGYWNREVAEMKLAYYKLKETILLPVLKEEIAKLSKEELNAPAFSGHDEFFVLNVHPELDDKTNENGG